VADTAMFDCTRMAVGGKLIAIAIVERTQALEGAGKWVRQPVGRSRPPPSRPLARRWIADPETRKLMDNRAGEVKARNNEATVSPS